MRLSDFFGTQERKEMTIHLSLKPQRQSPTLPPIPCSFYLLCTTWFRNNNACMGLLWLCEEILTLCREDARVLV